MKNMHRALFPLTILLAGCGQDGIIVDGIVSELDATHYQSRSASTKVQRKHTEAPTKTLRRSDGMRIDLQGGLLALRPLRFAACRPTLAEAAQSALNWLVPSAHAHGSGGDGLLTIVDVVEPADGEITELNLLPVAPNDYCGIVLELAPLSELAVEEHEEGEEPDSHGRERLVGHSVLTNPCYYPYTTGLPSGPLDPGDIVNVHECIEVRYDGAAREIEVALSEPLQVDAGVRSIALRLGIVYDLWFDDLAMEQLNTDPAEVEKMVANIAASFRVEATSMQMQN